MPYQLSDIYYNSQICQKYVDSLKEIEKILKTS